MKVTIDPNSGLCFGVIYAIKAAEEELDKTGKLYCLGDIVHNNKEVERLKSKGLIIINHEEFSNLYNSRVLIRAHGEPPETYKIALENSIELIDASCPVVLKLQNQIRLGNEEMHDKDGQIVIYGKDGHAEVNGLVGQTLETAIIINNENDLDTIDYSKPIRIYSQTTQSIRGYEKMIQEIKTRIDKANPEKETDFIANETICSQVSNRTPQMKTFASQYEVIVFVSGKKSSNGLYLYEICKTTNPNSYFVSDAGELQKEWFKNVSSVGVCGATSTPMWFMEEIADKIMNYE
jgi:4-hydroxy-3-methylbut-2-en-1-yl diphosphate reductase